ncbi:MAG: ParA family protein [Aquabacterium sp.]|nr:MAG: ParA family protein [Aquabacterium sp.]
MPVIVIANPKGGVGKSTLSTQVAGLLAHRGHSVMLGDVDRQQSSRAWLGLRPEGIPRIATWDIDQDHIAKPPKGTTHIVLDTPAGLHGKRLDEVMKLADKVLLPLQPSIFDIYATKAFLDELLSRRKSHQVPVGVIANRVKTGSLSVDQLRAFLEGQKVPVLAELRDTQNYVQLAARGLTLWDVSPSRVTRDLEQWQPIADWLER